MYTHNEILIANKTSRAGGSVGNNAVTPKIVKDLISPKDNKSILDFGAGKSAVQTLALRAEGYDVTAYEFGNNVDVNLHSENALKRKYDVIYASNVINVLSTIKMVSETLSQIHKSLAEGGIFIANYPASPRKLPASVSDMKIMLEEFFTVERIKSDIAKTNVVFKMTLKEE